MHLIHHLAALSCLGGLWYHIHTPSRLMKSCLILAVALQVGSGILDLAWSSIYHWRLTPIHTRLTIQRIHIPEQADATSSSRRTDELAVSASGRDNEHSRDSITVEVELNMPETWHAGPDQYILLWAGRASWLSLGQRHPFFVVPRDQDRAEWGQRPEGLPPVLTSQSMVQIRPRKGFTKRLGNLVDSRDDRVRDRFGAVVTGPFGRSHSTASADTIVMITKQDRIVSMLPYLYHVMSGRDGRRSQRVYLVWELDKTGEFNHPLR